MLVKNVVKGALYAGIVGAFMFGCGTVGVGEEELAGYDGMLARENGLIYHEGSIPVGNCDIVSDISMGSVIITGGSATIAVRATDPVNRLFISFSNEPNVYYELPLTDDDYLGLVGGTYLYTPVIYVSQESSSIRNNEQVSVRLVLQSSSCGRSTATTTQVTTQVVGSGNLQLALNWNTTSDVDLHVFLPNGNHVYYGRKVERDANGDTLVHLDRDANVSCADNGAAENVYFRTLQDGLYLVYLCLYTSCSGADFTLTATAGGRILDNTYLNSTRGNFSSTNTSTSNYYKIGVITVRGGRVVPTDYSASDVIAKMNSTLLRKALETEGPEKTK
ncbi:MAG: hypothetical protein LBB74_04195 [Chitinispirillales bacterium]|jgi:hypothetical protein|nr:hypothetical protein [Chitinispirillales bacterium]